MRVLLITDSLECGGRERQAALLALQLMRQNQDVLLLAYNGGHFEDFLMQHDIPYKVFASSGRYNLGFIWHTSKEVRRFRPNVIHSMGWMSGLCGFLLSRRFKRPLVENSIQRGNFPTSKTLRQYIVPYLGDVTVANSKAGLNAWGVNRGLVLYNGLELARLANATPKEKDQGKFICTMAATISSRKDYSSFVNAARTLTKRQQKNDELAGMCLEYFFMCLGDGTQRQAIERQASELVDDSRMIFTGLVDNVFDFLLISDVGVLMSTEGEGISNSILEYMYAGLPVVCSDCAGNRELIQHGWNGLIVPPFDHEALADAIEWLATHRKEATAMSMRNREKAKQFSAENMGKRALKIYEIALRRQKHKAEH